MSLGGWSYPMMQGDSKGNYHMMQSNQTTPPPSTPGRWSELTENITFQETRYAGNNNKNF